MATNIVKKLSMKVLLGNVGKFIPVKEIMVTRGDKEVAKEVPAIGETTWLANIVGIARGTKTGTSTYGEWTALVGDFIAEPLVGEKVGNRFRTGQLFLPDVVLFMITSALGDNKGVEFSFKVGIIAADMEGDNASATGYEYTADFLIAPAESDPLAALAAKALPAPAPETPAPAPETPAVAEVKEDKAPAKAK